MSIKITSELCYFLGLVTGRGKIYPETKIIVINFPATKHKLTGVPFCPKCDDGIGVVTKKSSTNVNTCKMCGKEIDPKYKIQFDYDAELIPAIKNDIFPIIKKIIRSIPIITKTENDVRISINFSSNEKLFEDIRKLFSPYSNYDNFEIPSEIHSLKKKFIKEFVVGIADSAGFPAWSGWWLDKDGIRTKIYFEFPNNWKLPVQLCNLLQNKFEIHTQTIDWGHPNFRDPNMIEYNQGKATSGFREHQLKYWADEFSKISYKLKFKKKIFDELYRYNLAIIKPREKQTCIPPSKITKRNITVHHPAEKSTKNPIELRGIHFDKFQQICWKLGCDKCDIYKSDRNSEKIFLTGLKESDDYDEKLKEIETHRKKLEKESEKESEEENPNSESVVEQTKSTTRTKTELESGTDFLEIDTYEPQRKWFQKYLEKKYPGKKIETFIGGNVGFGSIPGLDKEELEDFPIMPDVIGVVDGKSLAFIESKITKANLKEIGQLLSYCIIAKPIIAILCSTVDSEADLHPFLQHKSLNFGSNQIQCATWNQKKKIKKQVNLKDMKFYA